MKKPPKILKNDNSQILGLPLLTILGLILFLGLTILSLILKSL